nr:MAG TPA: hypothetical protein [Caudoviricetes sp.]
MRIDLYIGCYAFVHHIKHQLYPYLTIYMIVHLLNTSKHH